MNKSGYICAGFETLASIIDRFIKNEKNMYFDNFSRGDISNFLSNICSGFLHSYGQNFTNKKTYVKYNENEAKLFRKCRETRLFDNSTFIVDSGGFQASIGRINKNETRNLIDLYHNFLVDYCDVYDRAFILDLPPGPGCALFSNFDDIYKLNLETYTRASRLPDEVRNKIIYIHHFRTPRLWNIYSKILKDNDLFNKFNYHGTGGIVANMASDITIPCIIYIIPLIPLINQALRFKKKTLNFHILGGANFRDILFYESFKIHVKKIHNLDLNITYDSSGLFKGLMVGRYIPVLLNGKITKLDLRSKNLNLRFETYNQSRLQIYRQVIDEMTDVFSFKKIKLDNIYNDETGTFYNDVCVYSMLYMLYMYAKVQDFLKIKAKELYKIYESNNSDEYLNKITEITTNLNNGKITKKQKFKSTCLNKSLEILTNLDEDYCKYLVDKFLGKDEFTYLDPYESVLTC